MRINSFYFDICILLFVILIAFLLVFIVMFIFVKVRTDRKFNRWKSLVDELVQNTLFYEDADEGLAFGTGVAIPSKKQVKNKYFRKLLTDELIDARKNVSGSSANNLKRLYLQLELDKYAFSKLQKGRWYLKAQAIQELSIIGLEEAANKIYGFINYANELVRMEAQISVVKFYGFNGLKFLDQTTYPITEWQQIRLLHELSPVSPENFSGIETWLKSENPTVVIFALKLARNYYQFELDGAVVQCLEHADENVRLNAINTLGEIYNDETSGILIARYSKETFRQQLAIIHILQRIGTDNDIPVLSEWLDNENPELQLAIARALAKIGPNGIDSLYRHKKAAAYPLSAIIEQIKCELV